MDLQGGSEISFHLPLFRVYTFQQSLLVDPPLGVR